MPFCIGRVENFDEISLSCTVKKIEANFCFSIFGKNLKIQNGRHFWEEENVLKIAKSTFLRYPVGGHNKFCLLFHQKLFPTVGCDFTKWLIISKILMRDCFGNTL